MDDHPKLRAFATAVAVAAAIVAYFSAPLLGYADAGVLVAFGYLLAIGAAASWLSLHFDWRRRWEVTAHVAIAVALIGFAWQITAAQSVYTANQRRCAGIERDMLSATPRRSDAAGLFQALGCRPQTTDAVEMPAAVRDGRATVPRS